MTNGDTRIRFTFRIPKELLENLKKVSKRRGSSVNALILQILWDWIKENKMENRSA